jgi:serine beta-lactamase-like protein LACTB
MFRNLIHRPAMRCSTRLIVSWILIGFLFFVASYAQEKGVGQVSTADERYAAQIQKARAAILDSMARHHIPGAAIAVSMNDKLVWSEGFGYADLEQGVLATPSTKFRIGSISKSLTAAAVAQLVEKGKLDLDAPIQRYVPSFPVKKWTITPRQLAGHLTGIRHYRGEEFYLQRRFATVTDGLSLFANDTLLFEPGTNYAYTSYGWNLLSAAVEGASSESFLAYMNKHVFQPLGMRNTIADFGDSIITYRTRFYTLDSLNVVVNAPYTNNSYKWAGGGFLSTPEDLVTYGEMWLRPGFLKPETKKLFTTSQQTKTGKVTHYGMGWFIDVDKLSRPTIAHGGGSVGGTSLLILYPDQRFVVALICNSDERFVHVAAAMLDMFLNQ